MLKEIQADLVEALMDLGLADKQTAQHKDELIASLKNVEGIVGEYAPEDWQNLCDTLSRESHVDLFRGLIFASIFAWGSHAVAPVNAVFSVLNKRCWPDTVYSLIRWAMDVCDYYSFSTENYVFSNMLQSR